MNMMIIAAPERGFYAESQNFQLFRPHSNTESHADLKLAFEGMCITKKVFSSEDDLHIDAYVCQEGTVDGTPNEKAMQRHQALLTFAQQQDVSVRIQRGSFDQALKTRSPDDIDELLCCRNLAMRFAAAQYPSHFDPHRQDHLNGDHSTWGCPWVVIDGVTWHGRIRDTDPHQESIEHLVALGILMGATSIGVPRFALEGLFQRHYFHPYFVGWKLFLDHLKKGGLDLEVYALQD